MLLSYQGVWEADFCAVDGAIAEGFEQDEGLFVFGVEEDFALESRLRDLLERSLVKWWRVGYLERFEGFHCCGGKAAGCYRSFSMGVRIGGELEYGTARVQGECTNKGEWIERGSESRACRCQ